MLLKIDTHTLTHTHTNTFLHLNKGYLFTTISGRHPKEWYIFTNFSGRLSKNGRHPKYWHFSQLFHAVAPKNNACSQPFHADTPNNGSFCKYSRQTPQIMAPFHNYFRKTPTNHSSKFLCITTVRHGHCIFLRHTYVRQICNMFESAGMVCVWVVEYSSAVVHIMGSQRGNKGIGVDGEILEKIGKYVINTSKRQEKVCKIRENTCWKTNYNYIRSL